MKLNKNWEGHGERLAWFFEFWFWIVALDVALLKESMGRVHEFGWFYFTGHKVSVIWLLTGDLKPLCALEAALIEYLAHICGF